MQKTTEISENLHQSSFVKNLFDNMSRSYKYMNFFASFGFSELWRKQCIGNLNIQKNDKVADLLTGSGECWTYILKKNGTNGELTALDFSEGMLKHSKTKLVKYSDFKIKVLQEDIFNNSIETSSMDKVTSAFGLKTFSTEQIVELSKEIKRILKPGGTFSLIEVSVPKSLIMRIPYMFYLKIFIPILGFIFRDTTGTYKMLGIYTEKFGNCIFVRDIFNSNGFKTYYKNYFFGCATLVHGKLND